LKLKIRLLINNFGAYGTNLIKKWALIMGFHQFHCLTAELLARGIWERKLASGGSSSPRDSKIDKRAKKGGEALLIHVLSIIRY